MLPPKLTPNKFIIIGQPRAGTSILVEALNSHPDVRCAMEILLRTVSPGKTENKSHEERWSIINSFFDNKGVKGFKMMLVQAPNNIYSWLKKNNVKVIWVERGDVFRQVVSTEIARATGHWALNWNGKIKIKVDRDTFKINRALIQKGINATLNARNKFKEHILPDLDHIIIKYEDMVGEEGNEITEIPMQSQTKICAFLGVNNQKLGVKLKKQGNKDLSKTLINYEELKDLSLLY